MIVGIGTDLCDVRRLEEAAQRQGERFVARILGEQERTVFHERQSANAERSKVSSPLNFTRPIPLWCPQCKLPPKL